MQKIGIKCTAGTQEIQVSGTRSTIILLLLLLTHIIICTIFPFLAHCEQQTSEKFHILAKVETKNNLFEFPLATNQSKNSIQTQTESDHDRKTNNHHAGHRFVNDNEK